MSCVNLGRMEAAGPSANVDSAKRYFENACNCNLPIACAYLKIAFGGTRPVFPDVAATQAAQQRCNGGSARDCGIVGAFHLTQGLKPMAIPELDRACRGGDGFLTCSRRRRSSATSRCALTPLRGRDATP